MKNIILILCVLCAAAVPPVVAAPASPIYTKHKSFEEVDQEFKNIYLLLQSKEFTIVVGSSTADDGRNGKLIIDSTGTVRLCTSVDDSTNTWCFGPATKR